MMRKYILVMGLAVLVNGGLSGQIIVNETFDGTGDPLPAPWVLEAGTALKDDGSWAGKMGAFFPLSSLSPNTVYTITYDAFIPNTGLTEFGALALVTDSPLNPVDSVDIATIDKAGWFIFRENGAVESRGFPTGSISKTGFYIPGGGLGTDDSLVELVLTTGSTAADSTVSLRVDGVVFDMDNNAETPASLSGIDLSGLTFIGLTGYADHVVDTFTITAVPGSGTVTPPASVAVAIVGTDVQCTFDSVNGQSYQLLVSTDDMASFGPVIGASDTGDGSPITLTHTGGVPASGQRVFYTIETN